MRLFCDQISSKEISVQNILVIIKATNEKALGGKFHNSKIGKY